MTTSGYEFSAEQNEILRGLVSSMKRSGIVVAFASAILLGYQLVEHFNVSFGRNLSPAIYYLDVTIWCLLALVGVVVAALLMRATGAFTAVIQTTGNDVEHLMQGLARLRGLLQLIFWAASVGSVLLALSFTLLLTYS